MKKLLLVFLLVFTVAIASCGKQEDNSKPTEETPTTEVDKALSNDFVGFVPAGTTVQLTTCGQSDIDVVYNLLTTAGVPESQINSQSQLKADDCEDGSIVFLVLGTSNKGLGAAKTSVSDETKRASDFAAASRAGKIKLVIFHTGKDARRGDQSDPVIKAVAAEGKLLLVVDGGNNDGLFTNLAAEKNAPLYIYSKASKMVAPIKTLFNIQ